jgi:hypothetical protein
MRPSAYFWPRGVDASKLLSTACPVGAGALLGAGVAGFSAGVDFA